MKVLGYSERGLIDSLIYEICFSEDNLSILQELLDTVNFPYDDIYIEPGYADVLLDQDLSDFGHSDAVLLFDNDGKKQSLFMEAKTRGGSEGSWRIWKDFNKFKMGIDRNKTDSANLFVQLYHKVRLMKEIRKYLDSNGDGGAKFPPGASKFHRKIGDDKVVLQAVNRLAEHSDRTYYIMVVPEEASELQKFYNKILKDFMPEEFPEWDISCWGFISWYRLKEICEENGLNNTLENFRFNQDHLMTHD